MPAVRASGTPQLVAGNGVPVSNAVLVPLTRNATVWPPMLNDALPHRAANDVRRDSNTRGRPLTPSISAIPTARRWAGVAPAGAAADSTSRRNWRERTALRSVMSPSGETASGPLEPPGQTSSTRVGRRTAIVGATSRSLLTVIGPPSDHRSHAPGTQSPIHAVAGLPSNAREARH